MESFAASPACSVASCACLRQHFGSVVWQERDSKILLYCGWQQGAQRGTSCAPGKQKRQTLKVSSVSALASAWRYALAISMSLRRPLSVKLSCREGHQIRPISHSRSPLKIESAR